MADASWIDRLFQGGEQTRGLSGTGSSDLALSDANAFYNHRARRHFTPRSIAAEPLRLWTTHEAGTPGSGLRQHLEEVLLDDRPFTDVFLVLAGDDFDEAAQADPTFSETVSRVIGDAYEDLLRSIGRSRPERRLGVWLLREASAEVGGRDFGLLPGEFLTGVVPNLYRTPGSTSKAVVALHVNLFGVWGSDYREVGRLYDDQLLFTLGNHWLDNFSHPALREPALFSIRRDERGEIVHIVNPDAADRYQITAQDRDGISILTLATVQGDAVAYIVLWSVVEEPVVEPAPAPAVTAERDVAELELSDLEPLDEPAPAEPEVELEPVRRASRTILSESHKDRIFTFQERGALFQKVHFSAFMLGYDVYLGYRGEVGTVVDGIAATFQIRKKTVSLQANGAGVVLNGELVPQGEARVLEGDSVIEVGTQRLEYRDLHLVDVEGWPYMGEVRRPAASTYMLWGRSYPVGRSRECRVVLPDEPRNDNIVWKPKMGDGDTIHTKNGDIPKARFYTDSIMVASEHAVVDLEGETPQIVSQARNCYSFVRRGDKVSELYPTSTETQPQKLFLEPGDEVLVGNCVFVATFTPAEGRAVVPAPAPLAHMSTTALSDAVGAPNFDDLDAPPPRQFLFSPSGPAAPAQPARHGFGLDLPDEVDDAPPPPRVDATPRARWPHSITDVPEPVSLPVTDPAPPTEPRPRPADRAAQPAPAAAAKPAPVSPPVAPAASPAVSPPAAVSVPGAGVGGVVIREESEARLETARPARLVFEGWMVQGSATCGNHTGVELVVPESRMVAGQTFAPRTYFQVRARGRRGALEVIDSVDTRLVQPGGADSADGAVVEVIRRDDRGDEDFCVTFSVVEDSSLPDPRARLVRIDDSALSAGLFATGFPLRVSREVTLGPVKLNGRFDGQVLVLNDYLASYKPAPGGAAWTPFFVGADGGRFHTAPEDGSEIVLVPGDRLVAGAAVFRLVT